MLCLHKNNAYFCIFNVLIYILMKGMTKKDRLNTIRKIVSEQEIESQDVLLLMLRSNGFDITQATLSRDIKALKISKSPNAEGRYMYTLPAAGFHAAHAATNHNHTLESIGFISIEFSGQLGVIKTRPGYAMGIASDIDSRAGNAILGTIAGDDTILLIPREGVSRKLVVDTLVSFIPNIQQ